MAILTKLFGESPFAALEEHGEKVHACVGLLRGAFRQVRDGDDPALRETLHQVSALESAADDIRNQLHEQLASKVLMPMRREELYNILEQQDSMADRTEDIVAILTYRKMSLPADLAGPLDEFVELVLSNCALAAGVMSKLDLLVESSFGGRDAVTVSRLITELARREDTVKPRQIELARKLFALSDTLPPPELMLWLKVMELLAELAACADRTGNGVRMTLEIKPTK